MPKVLDPETLAVQPSRQEGKVIEYDWKLQGRISGDINAGNKQTFDMHGNPSDSTSGSGQTQQTFDMHGKPSDSRQD